MTVKVSDIMELVEIYAKHYKNVDGWSGKVLSSHILTPAYEAKKNVREAIEKLIEKEKK
jgi:hypothetical protein